MDSSRIWVDKVREATGAIRSAWDKTPAVGIILGTGLGGLADAVDAEAVVPYAQIPHFPEPTVETHAGRLLAGVLDGVRVVALQGRFHLYEGYSPQQVTFPVRVLAALGVRTLLVSNAAGGLDPLFRRGDLMLITDHVNLQSANPLVGPNVDEWGPRFPDMSEPYDPGLRETAEAVALRAGIRLRQGVYVAVVGPNLETPAEYRFLRLIGADAVGMSTVPEVIVARHAGMRVLALSVITDECLPDALEPISIPQILAAASEAEPNLTAIMRGVIRRIGEEQF